MFNLMRTHFPSPKPSQLLLLPLFLIQHLLPILLLFPFIPQFCLYRHLPLLLVKTHLLTNPVLINPFLIRLILFHIWHPLITLFQMHLEMFIPWKPSPRLKYSNLKSLWLLKNQLSFKKLYKNIIGKLLWSRSIQNLLGTRLGH